MEKLISRFSPGFARLKRADEVKKMVSIRSRGTRVALYALLPTSTTMANTTDASCYTIVFEDSSESPSTQELRAGLEKGSDDVKFDTLRKIVISTINGNPQVCL